MDAIVGKCRANRGLTLVGEKQGKTANAFFHGGTLFFLGWLKWRVAGVKKSFKKFAKTQNQAPITSPILRRSATEFVKSAPQQKAIFR